MEGLGFMNHGSDSLWVEVLDNRNIRRNISGFVHYTHLKSSSNCNFTTASETSFQPRSFSLGRLSIMNVVQESRTVFGYQKYMDLSVYPMIDRLCHERRRDPFVPGYLPSRAMRNGVPGSSCVENKESCHLEYLLLG